MLENKTVYFLGKLAASNRKEAADAVRRQGGKVASRLTPAVRLVVVGEGDVLSRDWNLWNDQLDDATRSAFEAGLLEIVPEAFFWKICGEESGEPENDKETQVVYTPSMLAELTGLPVSVIRRLRREGFIRPVRRVHRLYYFGFDAVLPLKIVRSMLDAGFSLSRTLSRLRRIQRHVPEGPLDIRVEGEDVLFVTEKGPVDQDGQHRFAFVLDPEPLAGKNETETKTPPSTADPLALLESVFQSEDREPNDVATLCEAAWTLESDGNLQGALDLYRAALAAGGPDPQINFQIAELLYRLGDRTAARERYFTAIELDEHFVEARANLGCVLVELGNDELAAAAFRGALKYHPEYAEVHFHLGMLLRRVGLDEEAGEHLRTFLELAPDSPWAERIYEEESFSSDKEAGA